MAPSLSYLLILLLHVAFPAECYAIRKANSNDDGEKYYVLAVATQVEGEYLGTKATMDVYNIPEVRKNQSSYCMINLYGYSKDNSDLNSITVGWHIDPDRYGDHYTHFFISSDEHPSEECFNLECKGFVVNNSSKIVPGGTIQKSPGKGKPITLEISKSQSTGDWLLHYEQKLVGYWPRSLLKCLEDRASAIYWGGQVMFLINETGPAMGSGHFPMEGKEKAASIWNVNVKGKNGHYGLPTYADPDVTDSSCYRVTNGDVIFYGGPAGCRCPDE